jgi:hypothetical protein
MKPAKTQCGGSTGAYALASPVDLRSCQHHATLTAFLGFKSDWVRLRLPIGTTRME